MKFPALILLSLMPLLNLATASSDPVFPPNGFCGLSPKEERAALGSINLAVAGFFPVPECGPGLWRRVADLDVTGADTTCPGEWTFLATATPMVNGCTRPPSGFGGCALASFSPPDGVEYSRVCGRITGRAAGTPNGYTTVFTLPGMVDGVTLTYVGPTRHIWSFVAAGGTLNSGVLEIQCPCNPVGAAFLDNAAVNFIGDNYFCEDATFLTDALWTGTDCTPLTPAECCNLNPRPYFTVTLDSPTTEDIEARICTGMGRGDEQVFVQMMEIFIQ